MGNKTLDKDSGLSFERVEDVLAYDRDTGMFRWREKLSDRSPVGKIAGGHSSSGHWRIRIDGRYYLAHRLAWLLVTGTWPEDEIDHKNTVRDDNRWENLRPCNHSQNHANTNLRSDNSTGYKGVQFCKQRQKFQATVYKDGERYHCGFHDDAIAAHAAYSAKAQELFGEFHRSGVIDG